MQLILLTIWSFLWAIATLMIRLLALVSPKWRRILEARLALLKSSWDEGSQMRAIFFCSSAGEYEQALPVINALEHNGWQAIIIFWSNSGHLFANARHETRPYFLAPGDSFWLWSRILKRIDAKLSFVVRHELWPGFLSASAKHGPLSLIAASRPHRVRSSLVHWWQHQMVRKFSHVFAVTAADAAYFKDEMGHPQVLVVGDPKYDRAYQRALLAGSHNQELIKMLGPAKRLIGGSVWPRDWELLLSAFKGRTARKDSNDDPWQLILTPHVPDNASVQSILALCQEHGLSASTFSSIKNGAAPASVIIIDCLGLLGELYSCCDLAFVGGALHHQVHNVLEPIFHGLPVAFGPLYKNSQEAIELVDCGIATVVRTEADVRQWWSASSTATRRQEIADHGRDLCGASTRITAAILADRT